LEGFSGALHLVPAPFVFMGCGPCFGCMLSSPLRYCAMELWFDGAALALCVVFAVVAIRFFVKT